MLARNQHVVRLDVAVHHAVLVGEGQAVHHVLEQADCVMNWQLAPAYQPGPKRLPLDQRHRVVQDVPRLTGSEQRDDMRMVQPRCYLNLAAEPIHVESGPVFRREDLHHYFAAQRCLLGDEDTAHPSTTQLAFEAVGGAKGLL
jgi:hypothetical protein